MRIFNSSIPFVCILSGGLGTRLGNIKENKPKCLTPAWTNEKWTLVDINIYSLIKSDFKKFDLIFCPSGGGGEQIEGYITNNWKKGKPSSVFLKIHLMFTKEREMKGTAVAIYQSILQNHYNDQVIIMVPVDTLVPGKQIKEALTHHHKFGAIITFLVSSKFGERTQNRGKILVNKSNKLLEYSLEGTGLDADAFIKDNNLTDVERMSSGGVMIINPRLFVELFDEYVQSFAMSDIIQEKIDFYRDFVPWLCNRQRTQNEPLLNYFDIINPVLDLGIADNLINWRIQTPIHKFLEWVENNR